MIFILDLLNEKFWNEGLEMCIFNMYVKGVYVFLILRIIELEVCLFIRKKIREIFGIIFIFLVDFNYSEEFF